MPASFDEAARQLTLRAATDVGLRPTLLEEPQAAFYAWLADHEHDWRTHLSVGDEILVCDLGGGTTDFTLIRVTGELGTTQVFFPTRPELAWITTKAGGSTRRERVKGETTFWYQLQAFCGAVLRGDIAEPPALPRRNIDRAFVIAVEEHRESPTNVARMHEVAHLLAVRHQRGFARE